MDAHIGRLGGKYYGTKIHTEFGDINVWLNAWGPSVAWAYEPSAREVAEWGHLEEGETEAERRSDMMSGGHYETALSYKVAEAIVQALHGLQVP